MAEKAAKKQNIFKRVARAVVRFFKDTRGEMKKVVWPSAKQVRNNFLVVVGFVLFAAVLILLLDFLFGHLLGFVVNLGVPAA